MDSGFITNLFTLLLYKGQILTNKTVYKYYLSSFVLSSSSLLEEYNAKWTSPVGFSLLTGLSVSTTSGKDGPVFSGVGLDVVVGLGRDDLASNVLGFFSARVVLSSDVGVFSVLVSLELLN